MQSISFEKNNFMTMFKISETDAFELLKKKVYEKLSINSLEQNLVFVERVNYELQVIEKYKLSSYFIIIDDLFKNWNYEGCLIADWHSTSSSLVLFLLNVTTINPIKNDLNFDRFINSEKPTFPTISIVTNEKGIDNIHKYLTSKFQFVSAPIDLRYLNYVGAINRHLKIIFTNHEVEKLNNFLNEKNAENFGFSDNLRFDEYFAIDIYPLQILSEQNINQSNLNLDFKLSNEQLLKNEIIVSMDYFEIFESFVKLFNPQTIDDLAICLNVCLPYLDELREQIIENKNSNKKCNNSLIEPYVNQTYCEIIYQEQIMSIAMDLGNFSSSQANYYRKALGKKHSPEIKKFSKLFQDACTKKGIAPQNTDSILEQIYEAASYCFCKAHAMSFAILLFKIEYSKHLKNANN